MSVMIKTIGLNYDSVTLIDLLLDESSLGSMKTFLPKAFAIGANSITSSGFEMSTILA